MTWDQVELFASAAAERAKNAQLMQANLAALGTAVGFSGDTAPLKKLARQMGGGSVSGPTPIDAPNPEKMREMREAIGSLTQGDMVRIKRHGSNSRRTERPARSVNKRVPRGSG